MFSARSESKDRGLEASYEMYLLIAKCGKHYTIGDNSIKDAISTFLKVVIEKDDQHLQSMPPSNNTVSSRIYEMRCDVDVQLVEKYSWTNQL